MLAQELVLRLLRVSSLSEEQDALESNRLLRLHITCAQCMLTPDFLPLSRLPREQRSFCSAKCNTDNKDSLGVSNVPAFDAGSWFDSFCGNA